MKLMKEQFERECDYRLSISIMKTLLRNGILTKEEYNKAEKRLIDRLNPVWGQLPRLAVVE